LAQALKRVSLRVHPEQAMGRSTLIVGALCAVISAGVRAGDGDLLVKETQSRASRCSEIPRSRLLHEGPKRENVPGGWSKMRFLGRLRKKNECRCKTDRHLGFFLPIAGLWDPGLEVSRYHLDGDDPACGQGVSAIFDLKSVSGKGCSCMRVGRKCPDDTQIKREPCWGKQCNFNLDTFISRRWYVQQQMETKDLPAKANYCVTAMYTKRLKKTRLGYDIDVLNSAANSDGSPYTGLGHRCVAASAKDPAKLQVAPCLLRKKFAAPYWILQHNEEKGYALVSGGGYANVATTEGCRTDKDADGSGLWILTREIEPDPAMIQEVRGWAISRAYDVRVLKNVSHNVCEGKPGYP